MPGQGGPSGCMCTCRAPLLHLVAPLFARCLVRALIMSPHADDAYYATADCGLCHDLDRPGRFVAVSRATLVESGPPRRDPMPDRA